MIKRIGCNRREVAKCLVITGLAITASCLVAEQNAFAVNPPDGEFTLDAEFDAGSAINVVHSTSDQLQLDDTTVPFNFIWIAVSSKGTVVKIDTETGEVLAEYHTAPQGMGLDPSRTTVDLNGNVWVTNRNEYGTVPAGAASPGIPATDKEMGSVVHFGLEENGGCVDRNGNGVIDTSTGLGDVRGWNNEDNADAYGGISTAEDECILYYVRVNAVGTRHVSVNSDNDVWVGGYSSGWPNAGNPFDLIDSDTGNIIRQEASPDYYGGYGGLIDGNGVIWSANPLLRWDTSLPLSGPNGGNWKGYSHDSYGLCLDNDGNVWNTSLSSNQIRKFAPNGALLGTYGHGSENAQGCVVDNNGDVWVAGSLYGNSVGHLLNDGTFVGSVTVGSGPTGVAVDAVGKIWATNYSSRTASRIDPDTGPIVNGVHVGAVDFTTGDLGGNLYNYSDMTGSTLTGAPDNGTWTAVHDATMDDVRWNTVSWTSDEPGDSSITVTVASSLDGVTFGPETATTNGGSLSMANGRYLRLTVSFSRSSTDEDMDTVNDSPVLYDISVDAVPPNEPPVAQCKDIEAALNASGEVTVSGADVDNGSFDPDGDPITIIVSGAEFNCSDIGAQHAVTLTVTDDSNESDTCVATVTVVDTLAPINVQANALATITPPDAPISFTATANDNCSVAVEITDYSCYKVKKNGSQQSKMESCVVGLSGDTITISDSGGVGDNIVWTIVATDQSGNTTTAEGRVSVDNPGRSGEKGNNGVGNGEDPQPRGNPPINDGPGTSPGNPGNKGKK
jgi:streptogramin lyase